MNPRVIRSCRRKAGALFCVMLVLNLHVWLGGCGGIADVAAPLDAGFGIDLTPDHPLAQALEGSALGGAQRFQIDPQAQTFRVVFADENLQLSGRYVDTGGQFVATEIELGRLGRTVTLSLDSAKHVTRIRTDDGFEWLAPAKPAGAAKPSAGDDVQAFVDANPELLQLAQVIDREAGRPLSDSLVPVAGSDEVVDLGPIASPANKTGAALAGPILLVLATLVLIWAPIVTTVGALLSIFLVLSLIQMLVAGLTPSPGTPPTGEPPPPVITDCNQNQIEDAVDIADGTSPDCNQNAIPDDCEADADGDGVIDACDICPAAANPNQEDADGDGLGDACETDLTVTAQADRSWVYEHLVIVDQSGTPTDASACPVVFSATVDNDPVGNSGYSFVWTVSPPSDRPGALFEEVSGGQTGQESFLPPLRPAFSPSGQPYLVTVTVTGNDAGNSGTASFELPVRLVGDVNNDGCADDADKAIIDTVELGAETDPGMILAADINCDGTSNYVIDRAIVDFVALDSDGHGACVVP